jgi:ferredoxin-NADP reductase
MPGAAMKLAYSVRTADDLIYADEIGDETALTYTREPPANWDGHTGRIDAAMIEPLVEDGSTVFVCGSNGFVEAAATIALEAGVAASRIRTERFGPTGF